MRVIWNVAHNGHQNEQQLSTSGTLESRRMALILLTTDN